MCDSWAPLELAIFLFFHTHVEVLFAEGCKANLTRTQVAPTVRFKIFFWLLAHLLPSQGRQCDNLLLVVVLGRRAENDLFVGHLEQRWEKQNANGVCLFDFTS